MTFLEPIIAALVVALIGAAAGAAASGLVRNKTAQTLLKYGPIAKKAYDIIDPVLDQNLRRWKGSQVDLAFKLAIEAASDGQLTKEEIESLAYHMAQAWLPQKAADKLRDMERAARPTLELRTAAKIIAKVNSAIH